MLYRPQTLLVKQRAGTPVIPPTPIAPPAMDSLGAVAYDTGFDSNLYEKAPTTIQAESPASLVKIMTSYILWQLKGPNGEDVLDSETVTVTTTDLGFAPSLLGLVNGDTFTWNEALYMMMHAADSAVAEAVARTLGGELVMSGGRSDFIDEMNAQAAALGMDDTTFTTPNGLAATTDRSTPQDIVTLLRTFWWINNKALRAYTNQASYTFTVDSGPSAGSIGPHANPIDLVEPILDYGMQCARGGALPATPTYHAVSVWQAPGGQEIILVNMFADTDGNRYLDHRAMYYELPDDFPHLLGAAGTDADFSNVVLLAGFDGSIVDESGAGRTLTVAGSAAVNATNPLVGAGDLTLDGTGDYIHTADAADLDVGSADATFECFIRGAGSEPGDFATYVSKWDAPGGDRQWMLQYNPTSNQVSLVVSTTGANTVFGTFDLDTFNIEPAVFFNGAKRHILGRIASGEVSCYVNGQEGDVQASAGAALFPNAARCIIGARDDSGGDFEHVGTIDEVRVTIGTDRTAGAAKIQVSGRAFPRS